MEGAPEDSGPPVHHALGGALRGRRMRADEVVGVVRERLGVELVAGVGHLLGGARVTTYRGGTPIASATHLVEAARIHLEPDAELAWRTEPVPHDLGRRRVVFSFPVAMGNGSPLPQPSGQFGLYIDDRRVLGFTLTKDNQTWEGTGCRLHLDVRRVDATAFGRSLTLDEHVRDESTFVDGVAFLLVPPEVLAGTGRAVTLRVVAEPREPSRVWFRVGRPLHPFLADHLEPGLSTVATGRRPARVGGYDLLLGDLHAHSVESQLLEDDGCGVGARDEMFRFARDVAGLDVFCLSEHDWQMNDEDWRQLEALNDKYDDPGGFVTLPGYEWTSANHGHRNVYLRDTGAGFTTSLPPGVARNTVLDDAPTPLDLWRHLDRQPVPAITVPHHMSAAWFPVSLERYHDPVYDRVAEIYSCWGDSLEHGQPVTTGADRIPELAFVHAIRRGHRVGFIASSDSHDGHPGVAQGRAAQPHLFHHLGSGRVALLADEHSRAGAFDALRARRCYALTGPRIAVDLSVEGHPMGSEIPASSLPERPVIDLDVASGVAIDRIDVYRNGERYDTIVCGDVRERIRWSDPRPPATPTVSYFVKIRRVDHECAWTSPVWIDRSA